MRKAGEESDLCQYCYGELELTTLPDTRLALPLRRRWWSLKRNVWYTSVLGPRKFLTKWLLSTRFGKLVFGRKGSSNNIKKNSEALNVEPGDWVEVRSAKEILATLDDHGKLKGLSFTAEMMKFCGGRFQVYKNLDKIILETTGELRRIKTPTVILKDAFCDGKAHGGCDRSCFCFWREEWLKKVPAQISKEDSSSYGE